MRQRRTVLLGFSVALFLGIAVYFRLWAIDRQAESADDDSREALRRQFERANMEAMDESAEWRMKYDGEVVRNRQIQDELLKVKASLSGATRRFDILHKENMSLQKQVESLKRQIEDKKQHCNCNHSSTQLR
ncbi:hypothetical protein Cni_G26864 [Canna indica]|uniref:Uncharacterized protein n=1 Tax=Canna indica TaxID=4628 RepID=A0AAQ3L4K2_9LILI|nr:hypothetical protein Cni_G26864 [Canna indica]